MTDDVNVPTKPTDAMVKAAIGQIGGGSTFSEEDRREMAGDIYHAMLAAAPKAEPVEADDFGDALLAFLFRHGLKVALDVSEIEALRQSAIRAQPEAPKVEQEPVAWRYRAGRAEEHWLLSRHKPTDDFGLLQMQPLYTHPAPASDELLEAAEDARTTISMLKRNVVNEINNHDGFFRWEGVPDALQARIDAINTALARHKEAQT